MILIVKLILSGNTLTKKYLSGRPSKFEMVVYHRKDLIHKKEQLLITVEQLENQLRYTKRADR